MLKDDKIQLYNSDAALDEPNNRLSAKKPWRAPLVIVAKADSAAKLPNSFESSNPPTSGPS